MFYDDDATYVLALELGLKNNRFSLQLKYSLREIGSL